MTNSIVKKWYLLFGLLYFSCKAPSLYVTKTPVVPLFQQKGELHLESGFSNPQNKASGDLGLSFKGAYAITNKLAISANYYINSYETEVDSLGGNSFLDFDNWGVNHQSFDMAVGRYWVDKGGLNPNWRAELFGGVGYAALQNQRDDGLFLNTKYLNYHLRPAFGYISENFGIFMSLKINYLSYIQWESDLINMNIRSFFREHDRKLIAEPSFGVQFGAENVKIQIHYATGTFINNTIIRGFSSSSVVANRMISISLFVLFKTQKPRIVESK